jgi:enoyl-CoA hydratase/carnithine racemase
LVGPAKAKDLIYSGRFASAEEAFAIGLVDRVLPDEQVYAAAVEAALGYARGPLQALRGAKVAVNWGSRGDFRSGLVIEREVFADLFSTHDQKEGMQAFADKRKAEFDGT